MLINKLAISVLCLSLFSPVFAADSYKELSHQYDLVFQQFLREKIEKLPKKVTVEIFLKNGTSVKGVFEGFCKYDDGVWILPDGKHGLFADDAYDISEIQDVRIIILRSI
jgi:sRNA-binding regulator protein Hfq